MIVVDGFARPLSYLNTAEIESVTVLKDGAATAVWGYGWRYFSLRAMGAL